MWKSFVVKYILYIFIMLKVNKEFFEVNETEIDGKLDAYPSSERVVSWAML